MNTFFYVRSVIYEFIVFVSFMLQLQNGRKETLAL